MRFPGRPLVVLALLVAGACSPTEATVEASAPASAPVEDEGGTRSTTTLEATSTPPAPTTPPTTTVPPPITVLTSSGFTATVSAVDEAELGASWRPGCPVPIADLRAIDMPHWDDQGRVLDGTLVVHRDHADALLGVFATLYEARYPIHSMRPITDFGADDGASMVANNTSAFNCRTVGGTSTWSQHAYGGAVDINPLVNPWVRGSTVDPAEGAPYVDRDSDVPGLIRSGDVVTEAFAAIGWTWGGDWTNTLDYQHFSHNGR